MLKENRKITRIRVYEEDREWFMEDYQKRYGYKNQAEAFSKLIHLRRKQFAELEERFNEESFQKRHKREREYENAKQEIDKKTAIIKSLTGKLAAAHKKIQFLQGSEAGKQIKVLEEEKQGVEDQLKWLEEKHRKVIQENLELKEALKEANFEPQKAELEKKESELQAREKGLEQRERKVERQEKNLAAFKMRCPLKNVVVHIADECMDCEHYIECPAIGRLLYAGEK